MSTTQAMIVAVLLLVAAFVVPWAIRAAMGKTVENYWTWWRIVIAVVMFAFIIIPGSAFFVGFIASVNNAVEAENNRPKRQMILKKDVPQIYGEDQQ